MTSTVQRYIVGVSLKMYFSHARTVEWCRAVAQIARDHRSVIDGNAELFVVPGYLSVPAAHEILGDRVAVGAQDLSTEDAGAFTGEVSGARIAEIGCSVVEVGHAERRRLFGENDGVVRAKTTAALRNGLTPVLCLGETHRGDPADAASACIRQFDDAVSGARRDGLLGRIIVAYEPAWAIGAAQPASAEHIRAVCGPLREHVREQAGGQRSAVIYGGSAGPGLLTEINDAIDGVFLGRFAHDPAAIVEILDEVQALTSAVVRG
jgi:triosephosphate isomerase